MIFRTIDLNLATVIRMSGRMQFAKTSVMPDGTVEFMFEGDEGVGPEMEAEFIRHKRFMHSRIQSARGHRARGVKREVDFNAPAEWLT